MESTIGLFKAECIGTTVFHHGPYKTPADVEFATAGWVDWCNHRRLHSSIGLVPPIEYEQAHYAALNPEVQPVRERHDSWGGSSRLPVGAVAAQSHSEEGARYVRG